MVGPSRAENVFGQMLICLRMSRLDYMVKETPYSAYVTIRKKFSKAVKDEQMEFDTALNENAIDEVKNVKNENIFLRQKIEDLEKECSNLRIDKEEMDLKIIVIEKDKLSLVDEVEEAFSQCKELRNNVKVLSDGNKSKQIELEELHAENATLKVAIENEKDLDKQINLLENNVKTHDLKIDELLKELESFEASTSTRTILVCKDCGSESDDSKKRANANHTEFEVSTSSKSSKNGDQ